MLLFACSANITPALHHAALKMEWYFYSHITDVPSVQHCKVISHETRAVVLRPSGDIVSDSILTSCFPVAYSKQSCVWRK